MPKINCKKCGEPCYLTEITSDGYCFECGEIYSEDGRMGENEDENN